MVRGKCIDHRFMHRKRVTKRIRVMAKTRRQVLFTASEVGIEYQHLLTNLETLYHPLKMSLSPLHHQNLSAQLDIYAHPVRA